MAGILDYKRYIELFETVEDVREHFPIEQLTINFDINGQGSDGWTGKITWTTLVVDQISYDRDRQVVFGWYDARANFIKSEVLGYFPYGEKESVGTGLLQFPVDMYTGPILPDSLKFVPITVVNFQFSKGTATWSHQCLLIENWCPGGAIGNPTDDPNFSPVAGNSSNLQLISEYDYVIQGDTFPLSAISDIPIDLTPTSAAKFYKITNAVTSFLGTATFVNKIATLAVDSTPLSLGTSTYFATFNGRQQYGFVRSNNLNLNIVEGYPLDISVQIEPDPSQPGVSIESTVTAVVAPGFPSVEPSGIANTATITISPSLPASGLTATLYTTVTNFDNGAIHLTIPITEDYSPTTYTGTNYVVLNGLFSGTNFTFNSELFKTVNYTVSWQSYAPSQIGRGTSTATFVVNTSKSFTVALTPVTVRVIDQQTGNSATNVWTNTPLSLQASINLGHSLAMTASDVTFWADYTDKVDIVKYTIPEPNPSTGTSKSVNLTTDIPRRLNNNQILIKEKLNDLVGSTFKFPTPTINCINVPTSSLLQPVPFGSGNIAFTWAGNGYQASRTVGNGYQWNEANWSSPGWYVGTTASNFYLLASSLPTTEDSITVTGPANIEVNQRLWINSNLAGVPNPYTTGSNFTCQIEVYKDATLVDTTSSTVTFPGRVSGSVTQAQVQGLVNLTRNVSLPDAAVYKIKFNTNLSNLRIQQIGGNPQVLSLGQTLIYTSANYKNSVTSKPYTFDNTTYTVVASTSTKEGQLLTLNTATAYSGYNKIWQEPITVLGTYTSKSFIVRPYSVDAVEKLLIYRLGDPTGQPPVKIQPPVINNSYSPLSTLKNLNKLNYVSNLSSLRSFVTLTPSNGYFFVDHYDRTVSVSTSTLSEVSNYDLGKTILFNGLIKYQTNDLGNYIKIEDRDFGELSNLTSTVTITQDSTTTYAEISNLYYTNDYNVGNTNGVIAGTLTNVLYVDDSTGISTGTVFNLPGFTEQYQVVGRGTNFVRVDPPWSYWTTSSLVELRGSTTTMIIPSADEQHKFAVNKITALKAPQQGVPYFTGAYTYNKVKFAQEPLIGATLRLKGNTQSSTATYSITEGPDIDGFHTINPAYSITGLNLSDPQWLRDNQTYSYFMAFEANRDLALYSPFITDTATVVNYWAVNTGSWEYRVYLDFIPYNLKVGATFQFTIYPNNPTFGVTYQRTVTGIDPIKNYILIDTGVNIPAGLVLTFVNPPPTTTEIFLGTATLLSTVTNTYLWRDDDVNLPIGSYQVKAKVTNHLVTGTNVYVTYPGNSVQSYNLQTIEGLNANLELTTSTYNSTSTRLTFTCKNGNSIDPSHWYRFENAVTFNFADGSQFTSNDWQRIGTGVTQAVSIIVANSKITGNVSAYWPGSINYVRQYDDQLLFFPDTVFLYSGYPTSTRITALNWNPAFTDPVYGTYNIYRQKSAVYPITIRASVDSTNAGFTVGGMNLYRRIYTADLSQRPPVHTPVDDWILIQSQTLSSSTQYRSADFVVPFSELQIASPITDTVWVSWRVEYLGDASHQSSVSGQTTRGIDSDNSQIQVRTSPILSQPLPTLPVSNIVSNNTNTGAVSIYSQAYVAQGSYDVYCQPVAGYNGTLLDDTYWDLAIDWTQISADSLSGQQLTTVSPAMVGDYTTVTNVSYVDGVLHKKIDYRRTFVWPDNLYSDPSLRGNSQNRIGTIKPTLGLRFSNNILQLVVRSTSTAVSNTVTNLTPYFYGTNAYIGEQYAGDLSGTRDVWFRSYPATIGQTLSVTGTYEVIYDIQGVGLNVPNRETPTFSYLNNNAVITPGVGDYSTVVRTVNGNKAIYAVDFKITFTAGVVNPQFKIRCQTVGGDYSDFSGATIYKSIETKITGIWNYTIS